MGGKLGIVGHEDKGVPGFPMGREEEFLNLGTGVAIKVARWFIGEKKLRFGHAGPGNGHALLFSARELHRIVAGPLSEADAREPGHGPAADIPLPFEFERDADILEGGEGRDELEILEDKADVLVAEPGPGILVEGGKRFSAKPDLA